MCCLILSIAFFGPRLSFIVYWFMAPAKVSAAFDSTLIWPVLGLIFLPWATLGYAFFFPVAGWEWIVVGLAALVDLGTWAGGGSRRRQVRG